MNKKPAKANLFRFVTLRNPQLLDENNNAQGFIHHPNASHSNFITLAQNAQNTSDPIFRNAVDTFNPLSNRSQVRNQGQSLYDFSLWLMRNKNHLSLHSIVSNKKEAIVLSGDKELLIWENLLYQTIEKKSVHTREALIQMLVANKFLQAFEDFFKTVDNLETTFTEEQAQEFLRRANASIVVPNTMLTGNVSSNTPSREPSKQDQKSFTNETERILIEKKLQNYEALLASFEKLHIVYTKENDDAYNVALSQYNNTVDRLRSEARDLEPVIDPKTGTEIPQVADIEAFEFVAQNPLDVPYLMEKFPEEVSSFALQEDLIAKLDAYRTIPEVIEGINDRIKKMQKQIIDLAPEPSRTLNVRGANVQINGQRSASIADFNFIPLHEEHPDGTRNILMQVFNYVTDTNIADIGYGITLPDGTTFSSENYEAFSSSSITLLTLFPELISIPENITYFDISGTIDLTDGTELDFQKRVIIKSARNFGDFDEVSGNDNPLPPTEKQVFGITNLGIADFRRVEQEVSCYVPGEVSHIENILAKEYKERSTRSLNSIQTESETISDRETENLRDTTTTERNELQTEASTVLNEDEAQNYGSTANFSYSSPGGINIGLGAYADFSSASSTSESNSQAQTYAQEVTERALERVVQKVTSRRTSIVLREFEENNVHGFDNTKGKEHITGVYRWVDKIYKNQLVNYGKRLTYEFAIPEPSRFFKEAIYRTIQEGNTDNGTLVEPIAPVAPNYDSDSIGRFDYQEKAAVYGAEVNAPLEDTLKVGKAFSEKFVGDEAQGDGDYLRNSQDYELEIPEGYYCDRFDVRGNALREGGSGNTLAEIIVGHKKHIFTGPNSHRALFQTNVPLDRHFTETLPISITTEDIEPINFNITAHCELSTQYFRQWQNETYAAILSAYQDRLAEYQDAKDKYDALVNIPEQDQETINFNPLINRSLEQKELKRICIELMAEQCGLSIDKNSYGNTDADTCIAPVIATKALQDHASTVRFFEQVFDWDLIAYTFYPYFYGAKQDWKRLFQTTDSIDPLFQAFLQAGMARAVVPVRPGFEDAINWYMQTGELWLGQGLVTDTQDQLYLSIAEELQTVDGEVEATWETRVPTSLTIVQADSASLMEGGLPCYDPKEERDNTIVTDSNVLNGEQETELPDPNAVTF